MSVSDLAAGPMPPRARRRRRWVVAVVLLLLAVAGLTTLSLRSHSIHQRHARALERDLMTYLPKVPGVRVMPATSRHWVTGQEGGSSDCEADASVQVATTMSADDLANLLNDTTPVLATARSVRLGVVLVQNYTHEYGWQDEG
jgi:hypothetical protein